MAVNFNKELESKTFSANDREVIGSLDFGTEAYVTGGFEIDKTQLGESDGSATFKRIDWVDVESPVNCGNGLFFEVTGRDNSDESNPKFKVKICKLATGGGSIVEAGAGETFPSVDLRIAVHGVPLAGGVAGDIK